MNTKEPDHLDRFIELRAQGWSFNRIAAELKIAKSTLILWSRKHHQRIQNLRALEFENMAQLLKFSRPQCFEDLGEHLRRIRDEIAKRDLADIPTARLFALAMALRTEANRLNASPVLIDSAADASPTDPCFDPTISWPS